MSLALSCHSGRGRCLFQFSSCTKFILFYPRRSDVDAAWLGFIISWLVLSAPLRRRNKMLERKTVMSALQQITFYFGLFLDHRY